MTFPEVHLGESGRQERIKNIKKEMNSYINQGLFSSPQEEFIYLERTKRYVQVRQGLVVAIDLDNKEWKLFRKALIRATEATIIERIPPRMEIRKKAIIETPYIMLLVKEPKHSLVEGLLKRDIKNRPLYNCELMMTSGSVKGWAVSKI